MAKSRTIAAAIQLLVVLLDTLISGGWAAEQTQGVDGDHRMVQMGDAKFKDWLAHWERNMHASNPLHYCTTATGESIGWFVQPFLRGFYYGYLATRNARWVDMLVNCTDALVRRAVQEPDGFLGWPTFGAAGIDVDQLDNFYADSMLGEAMALDLVVLMGNEIRKNAVLKEKYGSKFEDYITLSERVFKKWDARGAWRETAGDGIITVELPIGINLNNGKWIGFQTRNAPGNGFSHQDNKANLIAEWLLAMFDTTKNPLYRDRADKWFRVMKSRGSA